MSMIFALDIGSGLVVLLSINESDNLKLNYSSCFGLDGLWFRRTFTKFFLYKGHTLKIQTKLHF
jgi:hypothetical protein